MQISLSPTWQIAPISPRDSKPPKANISPPPSPGLPLANAKRGVGFVPSAQDSSTEEPLQDRQQSAQSVSSDVACRANKWQASQPANGAARILKLQRSTSLLETLTGATWSEELILRLRRIKRRGKATILIAAVCFALWYGTHLLNQMDESSAGGEGLIENCTIKTLSQTAQDDIFESGADLCSMPRIHSCSSLVELSHLRPCPRECPLIVPSQSIACAFMCVKPEECSFYQPSMAYPNVNAQRCEPCSVSGCRICSTPDTCAACFASFDMLDSGKQCRYMYDVDVRWFLESYGASIVGVLLVIIGCFIRRAGLPTDRSREILRLARVHHHWCHVRDYFRWGIPGRRRKSHAFLSGPEKQDLRSPPMLRLTTNLHTSYVVDMGMQLFYNFLLFQSMLLFIFLLMQSVHRQYAMSEADSKVLSELDSLSSARHNQVQCATILVEASHRLDRFQHVFNKTCFKELCAMYCVGLISTIIFAYYQRHHANWFRKSVVTMRHFALSVRGFPKSAIDELEIKRVLEEQFGTQLACVSIAYEVHQIQSEVQRLLDRHLEIEDVRNCIYSHGLTSPATATHFERGDFVEATATIRPQKEREVEIPAMTEGIVEEVDANGDIYVAFDDCGCRWLGKKLQPYVCKCRREDWLMEADEQLNADILKLQGELKNAGEVFAVFHNAQDCARVLDRFARGNASRRSFPLDMFRPGDGGPLLDVSCKYEALGGVRSLRISQLRCEPLSIGWFHYGFSKKERFKWALWALLKVVLFVLVLYGLVVVPYIFYAWSFTSKVHYKPGGIGMTVFGILLGTINWLMCVFLAATMSKAGFLREELTECFIFCCFTIMMVANNIWTVWLMYRTVWTNQLELTSNGFDVLGSTDLQVNLAEEILAMLFPGGFVPCLMWPVNGFFWPFIQGFLALRVFSKKDSFTVRQAEAQMEPLPIGLAWDYQGLITCPVLGFSVLFLTSNASLVMLFYVFAWCLFFYCLEHITHLRWAQMAYCTSNRLDTAVLYAWGIVLGELAASAAWRGSYVYGWHWSVIPLSFCVGSSLLWVVLFFGVRAMSWSLDDPESAALQNAPPLSATEEQTIFTWVNCNPILVLKARVCDLSDMGVTSETRYFKVGKSHAEVARCRNDGIDIGCPETWCLEPGSLYKRLGLVD